MKNFIHLHIHSHYSLLDGLPKIDQLLDFAQKMEMPALGLTDHGSMYGIIEFYKKAKEKGIKPIIGVEFYLAPNGMDKKRPNIDRSQDHLICLAKNYKGYQNLIKLVTKAWLEGYYYKPRIDKKLLKKHSEGLICLTSCLKGEIPRIIISKDLKKAERITLEYQEIFGRENFFLELQDHPNLPEQKIVNKGLIEISKKFKIPLVATNDVHYLKKEDDLAQDILICLQTKKKLADKKRMTFMGEDFSFRSQKEMIKSFKEFPEAIINTEKISQICNLEIPLGKIFLPYFETPQGKTPDEYLKELAFQGLKKRYPNLEKNSQKNKILQRLNYELEIIQKTGFASYFLIVADFVNWAKENDILVGPGRGSATGSLVSYLLNITNIDPLKFDLLFERFLNPERISLPDIDLDFSDKKRNKVIEYIEKKYGKERIAQISTFGTMAARVAVRDVGRVQNLPYSYSDQLAKIIPFGEESLDNALEKVSELRKIYQNEKTARDLINLAKKLEGVARHISTHACGLVITQNSLDNYLPLQHPVQNDKTIVTQYDMNSISDLGLLKIDILGLKNLTILEETRKRIKKERKIEINFDNIPLDDAKTFTLYQKAETTAVFQFESLGIKRYLKELKPSNFEDISAMVALYRPGPMDWIKEFILRKHKKKKIVYLHQKLKPILEKTYGIAIYQEQIIEIAQKLAGFSPGQADILRKAIAKKVQNSFLEQKEKFIQGCYKNKISKKLAEEIFDKIIQPFAGYGFNKSHTAPYSLIGYWTAYLKANYPLEFMTSLLITDQEDIDRIAIEITECRNLGIEIIPLSVNESFVDFSISE